VSSTVLYLAIVAIWAGFLVPAWVRRPHAKAGSGAGADREAKGDRDAGNLADAPGGDAVSSKDPRVVEFDEDVTVEADIHVEITRHNQEYRDDVPSYVAESGSRPGASDDQDYGGEPDGADFQRPAARPSQSREQMLRARRRMLTILVTMTLVTGGFSFMGLVAWWICVPPAAMLLLYALLLREIAMADAEMARKQHEWMIGHARAARARAQAEEQERAAAMAAAESGAQVIDISGRVGDQLYDQYADAAVRAVGD
jgi:hypothetical protein